MSTRVVLLSLASLALACNKADPAPDASPSTQSQAQAQAQPQAPSEAAVKSAAQPEKRVDAPVVAPAEPLPPVPTDATPIQVLSGEVEWKKLDGVTTITDFRPFVIGLLAECDTGPCKLLDDNRVEPDDVDLPPQKIWGIWRSDAWIVTSDEALSEDTDERSPTMVETTYYQRWRGSKFVTQHEEHDEYSPDGMEDELAEREAAGLGEFVWQDYRKGWAGGLLVRGEGGLVRLPKSDTTPVTGKLLPSTLTFFEAESGAFFVVTIDSYDDPREFVVHPPCPSGSCSERALKLPKGPPGSPRWLWDFPLDVPRGGDALTILAVATIGNADESEERAFLIHYDPPGRWTFEALRSESEGEVSEMSAPELLWPDTKGGLWVELDGSLHHRRADGQWFYIDPPGAEQAYANRLKPREFLVLTREEDGTMAVYATRGVPKVAAPDPADADEVAPAPVPEAAPLPTPAPEAAPAPAPEAAPAPAPA